MLVQLLFAVVAINLSAQQINSNHFPTGQLSHGVYAVIHKGSNTESALVIWLPKKNIVCQRHFVC